jgi:uncharacterized protein YukE
MTRALVDPVAMSAAKKEATEALTDMTTRLNTLTNTVDAAIPGFQGPAGMAFINAWGLTPEAGMQGQMRAILRRFEYMASIVGVGAVRHTEADQASATSIGQVVPLGPIFTSLNPGA